MGGRFFLSYKNLKAFLATLSTFAAGVASVALSAPAITGTSALTIITAAIARARTFTAGIATPITWVARIAVAITGTSGAAFALAFGFGAFGFRAFGFRLAFGLRFRLYLLRLCLGFVLFPVIGFNIIPVVTIVWITFVGATIIRPTLIRVSGVRITTIWFTVIRTTIVRAAPTRTAPIKIPIVRVIIFKIFPSDRCLNGRRWQICQKRCKSRALRAGDLQRGLKIRTSLQTAQKAGRHLSALTQSGIITGIGQIAGGAPGACLGRGSRAARHHHAQDRCSDHHTQISTR